jgi:hypothetical protein
MVALSFPLKLFSTPRPMPMPTGVMTAKTKDIPVFLRREMRRGAIKVSYAIPSKTWWNVITAKRVGKKVSPDTTRVRPINSEWQTIPASRTVTEVIAAWECDAFSIFLVLAVLLSFSSVVGDVAEVLVSSLWKRPVP